MCVFGGGAVLLQRCYNGIKLINSVHDHWGATHFDQAPLRPLKFDNSPFLKWWLEDKPFLLGWQTFKGHIINFSMEYMICIYIYTLVYSMELSFRISFQQKRFLDWVLCFRRYDCGCCGNSGIVWLHPGNFWSHPVIQYQNSSRSVRVPAPMLEDLFSIY